MEIYGTVYNVEDGMPPIAISYSDASVKMDDIANKMIVGRNNVTAFSYKLFTTKEAAAWILSEKMLELSYPLASVSLTVNRKAFLLEVGDLFKLTYSLYNITDMVFRVISIQEENIEQDTIVITAIEDVYNV